MLSNIAMSWDIDVGLGFENWGIFMGNFRNYRALEHTWGRGVRGMFKSFWIIYIYIHVTCFSFRDMT